MAEEIIIKGARLHNLKNVTLRIPKRKLVVLTGVSGSGKSTLAFDTLHKEGQRQYMESMGLVTDYLSKPKIDSIVGLSPSISVGQHLTNRSPRSTVGTETEVYTYLRVLYAKIGRRLCPGCGMEIPPAHDIDSEMEWDEVSTVEGIDPGLDPTNYYPCPHCGAPVPELTMAHFSFNKLAGACPTCTGLGVVTQANLERLFNADLSILDGAVYGWDRFYIENYSKALRAAGHYYGFVFDLTTPIKDLGHIQHDLLLYGVESAQFRSHFPDKEPPKNVATGRFEGIVTNIMRRYAERIEDQKYRQKMEKLLVKRTCPDCQGMRLREESRRVTVAGKTIIELAGIPLTEVAIWLSELPQTVSGGDLKIVEPVLDDLQERVQRLVDVGIGYLTLERGSPTLSAGEAQRLRLAALLGSGLTGVLYVLDEPTVGLHQRDTAKLIKVLQEIRDLGNTVLVIEHDMEMMDAADYIIDIGPGAGQNGGRVVAAGPKEVVSRCPESITGQYLAGSASVPIPSKRRNGYGGKLVIMGAKEHNLKNVTVQFPLKRFITVTGVSGSGKSSLLFDILDRAARQRFYAASEPPGEHNAIIGWNYIDKVITIDQNAIGRTPRSNAATYTDLWGYIRKAFAVKAREQGIKLHAGDFSFNVPGGRCEKCEGAGSLTVSMHFLPDVEVRCPVCQGQRFKKEVLAVKYRGASISDVLDMTITDARVLFLDDAAVEKRLSLLVDVGLGYLKLGQPATTLSGGEAQRVKLAKELGRQAKGHTLYLLDEPTTGLHPADVSHLLLLLQRLVDAGNTVIVIEHNIDIIKASDWVIDLGPEGGESGGYVVAEGTPEEVALVGESYTAQFL